MCGVGSLMIKHLCNLDDSETVQQISENMYMQYFLGYSSFTAEVPFDASLFVDLRKRIGKDLLNAINERIVSLHRQAVDREDGEGSVDGQGRATPGSDPDTEFLASAPQTTDQTPRGRVLMDATVCPQDIAYPTDLGLLSESREKTEELIDALYDRSKHTEKARSYRICARKEYLEVVKKRRRSKKEVRRAVGKQLNYVKRNLGTIDRLLDTYGLFPLDAKQQRYLLVIRTLYARQPEMHSQRSP